MIRSTSHVVLLAMLHGQNDGCESLSWFPAHSSINIPMRESEQIPIPACCRHTAQCDCSVETTSSSNHQVKDLSLQTSEVNSLVGEKSSLVEWKRPRNIIFHLPLPIFYWVKCITGTLAVRMRRSDRCGNPADRDCYHRFELKSSECQTLLKC